MWPAGMWVVWPIARRASRPYRPDPRDRILARTRHPSFTPEIADDLLADLSPRQLRRLWRMTTEVLEAPLPDDVRLHVVVLRAHLLARLESLDPWALRSCARASRR